MREETKSLLQARHLTIPEAVFVVLLVSVWPWVLALALLWRWGL